MQTRTVATPLSCRRVPTPAARTHPEPLADIDPVVRKTKKVAALVSMGGGMVGGPARMYLGATELRRARHPDHVALGLANLTAGALSTVYGTIMTCSKAAIVISAAGLTALGGTAAGLALALGGPLVAGFTGGATVMLRASREALDGAHTRDASKLTFGGLKAVLGGVLMAGGAMMSGHVVLLASLGYMGINLVDDRASLVQGARTAAHVVKKLFTHQAAGRQTLQTQL